MEEGQGRLLLLLLLVCWAEIRFKRGFGSAH